MKCALLLIGCVLTPSVIAQSPCLIVQHSEKLKGMASWTWKAQHNWKPFEYVAGDFPQGIKFKSGLKDDDIQRIRDKGGKVVILPPEYAPKDLDEAKQSCKASN